MRDRYRTGMVPVENQLAAGQPAVQEQRRIQPATSKAFEPDEEFDYVELDEQRQREPLRQRRYLDEEESRYEPTRYDDRPAEPRRRPLQAEPLPRQERPLDARPLDARPLDARPLDARPVEPRSLEPRPLERRPAPTPYREPLDVDAEDLPSNDLGDPW